MSPGAQGAFVVVVGFVVAGCVVREPVIVQAPPPPPPPQGGRSWSRSPHRVRLGARTLGLARRAGYVWVPGQWVVPARAGYVWVPGHWATRGRGYVWIDGHWR